MTAAIVLAAGLSRRMGRPKLLLTLEGRPVIRHTVERMLAAGLSDVIVVVGPEHEAIRQALEGLPVRLAVNPTPEAGQASSVRRGIQAVSPLATVALIALGDQPWVSADVIHRLLAALAAPGKRIAAPRYADGLGNPVLFAADVFPELLALTGDRGARAVVEKDASRLAVVDVAQAMPRDLDTPEDYERLKGPDNSR
ncbi:MAG TPA: nucleotidyltransferase family protein [Candidatus Bathyarchaeia archaeon]|nr:nucleotidyltransferase family protein [Candidatus Bathyarchaeia archaeon]